MLQRRFFLGGLAALSVVPAERAAAQVQGCEVSGAVGVSGYRFTRGVDPHSVDPRVVPRAVPALRILQQLRLQDPRVFPVILSVISWIVDGELIGQASNGRRRPWPVISGQVSTAGANEVRFTSGDRSSTVRVTEGNSFALGQGLYGLNEQRPLVYTIIDGAPCRAEALSSANEVLATFDFRCPTASYRSDRAEIQRRAMEFYAQADNSCLTPLPIS